LVVLNCTVMPLARFVPVRVTRTKAGPAFSHTL
jgi:hypothetical protein